MFRSPPVSGEPDGFAKVMYTEKCDVSVHNNCDTCRFLCQSRFYEILVLFGRVELKDGQIQRLHIYIYTHIYISCIYICVFVLPLLGTFQSCDQHAKIPNALIPLTNRQRLSDLD